MEIFNNVTVVRDLVNEFVGWEILYVVAVTGECFDEVGYMWLWISLLNFIWWWIKPFQNLYYFSIMLAFVYAKIVIRNLIIYTTGRPGGREGVGIVDI